METMENNLVIEITRDAGVLTSVKAIMPTWTRVGTDGQLYAKMPFIGGQETVGADEQDLEIAVNEAFAGFCTIAEKHGLGLENELTMLGWTTIETIKKDVSLFSLFTQTEALSDVLATGDTRALNYDVPVYSVLAA